MYFQDEVVQELKQIYSQLQEEEEWDLSLQSLQQVTQDTRIIIVHSTGQPAGILVGLVSLVFITSVE